MPKKVAYFVSIRHLQKKFSNPDATVSKLVFWEKSIQEMTNRRAPGLQKVATTNSVAV
ncbi:MAG: hypothetical protein F6K40_31120 [Okeania sp. SIO3I5]|uniref:hypothetical protein n=1 Tax=Okeania sp. SIO3I5 TaxID=2607805 RepID=UPI0013BBDFEF|nr:hypothetical protein [Okeania sp. SIO3I5]NEQ40442.1 hypothetical protein [Okeania sp. SIO3I5]